jgi:hypothetical protein
MCARGCDPVRDCPTMTAELDRLVAGITVDQLAAEHAQDPAQPAPPGQ